LTFLEKKLDNFCGEGNINIIIILHFCSSNSVPFPSIEIVLQNNRVQALHDGMLQTSLLTLHLVRIESLECGCTYFLDVTLCNYHVANCILNFVTVLSSLVF